MSEYQKQVRFLMALVSREKSPQTEIIQEKIQQVQQEERSLRRLIFLLFVLTLFSCASLFYGALFAPNFFADCSQLVIKLPCSLGLASVLSLVVFTSLWLWRRALLNTLYHECRRLIIDPPGPETDWNRR